jgi:hypothetical protein
MPHRILRLALMTTAGLALSTANAVATEGPPGMTPLPNPLAPVTLPPASPPVAGHVRQALPRVIHARMRPRRVREGHRSRLLIELAAPGRVRVVVQRVVRGHAVRGSTRMITAPTTTLVLRTSARLRRGRYRITVVAFDGAGRSGAAVHRSLRVVAR